MCCGAAAWHPPTIAPNHHVPLLPSPSRHRRAAAAPVQARAREQHDALLPAPARRRRRTRPRHPVRFLDIRDSGAGGIIFSYADTRERWGADHALGGAGRRRARRAVARAAADPALDVPRRHDRVLSAQVRPPCPPRAVLRSSVL